MGYRLFIFEPDGRMRHIPQRIANGLPIGDPPLPEYAGSRLRYVFVSLTTENRRPVAIRRIDCGYFSFDARGNPQEGLAQGAIEATETWDGVKKEKAETGQVVSVTARIARKDWEHEHRWTPTTAEVDQIRAAILPKKVPEHTPRPTNRRGPNSQR
jgi:hypothetical protein